MPFGRRSPRSTTASPTSVLPTFAFDVRSTAHIRFVGNTYPHESTWLAFRTSNSASVAAHTIAHVPRTLDLTFAAALTLRRASHYRTCVAGCVLPLRQFAALPFAVRLVLQGLPLRLVHESPND